MEEGGDGGLKPDGLFRLCNSHGLLCLCNDRYERLFYGMDVRGDVMGTSKSRLTRFFFLQDGASVMNSRLEKDSL